MGGNEGEEINCDIIFCEVNSLESIAKTLSLYCKMMASAHEDEFFEIQDLSSEIIERCREGIYEALKGIDDKLNRRQKKESHQVRSLVAFGRDVQNDDDTALYL